MSEILDFTEEDIDMVSDGIESCFKEPYCIANSKSMGLDNTYVLNLSINSSNKIVAGLSNNSVRTFDENLTMLNEKKLPSNVIDVKFSPKQPELFYTGTPDCIQLWDMRTKNEEGIYQIKTNGDYGPKPMTTFDINNADQFMVAGTEVVKHDSFLLFWDIRSKNMLGGYWETFGEDITETKFSPNDPNQLITGASDGQINVFDISQDNEDDALVTTLNVEAPVKSVTWMKDDKVGVVLDHEELLLWKLEDSESYKTFSREDLTVAIKRKVTAWTYIAGCHYNSNSEKTFVLSGSSFSSNPCLRLLNLSKTKLKPVANLTSKKASASIVRSTCIAHDGVTFVTGSENGLISIWSPGETNLEEENGNSMKSQKKTKSKKTPYSK